MHFLLTCIVVVVVYATVAAVTGMPHLSFVLAAAAAMWLGGLIIAADAAPEVAA